MGHLWSALQSNFHRILRKVYARALKCELTANVNYFTRSTHHVFIYCIYTARESTFTYRIYTVREPTLDFFAYCIYTARESKLSLTAYIPLPIYNYN